MRAPAWLAVVAMVVALGLTAVTCSSPGDRCQSDSECGGDLICARPEVDGGPAAFGACTHRPAGLGGFCRLADDCGDSLICSNELPAPTKQRDGTCIPLREAGQSCANTDQCVAPLECQLTAPDDGTCATPPDPDAGTDAGPDPDAAATD